MIRPVKGLEPGLYECLASTFQQAYPKAKLTIYLCVESTDDPAYPVLRQVVADFPDVDARIFVEQDDPLLHGARGHVNNLGPNPKVRNISRAYREAKGDVIWIVDCNVWVSKNAAGRMVDKLYGFQATGAQTTPYKFVHQLPIVVDMETLKGAGESQSLLPASSSTLPSAGPANAPRKGGQLEEMFMATIHAKFYYAINTVGIAPATIGKSNMFRKSHLEQFTDPSQNPILSAWEVSRGRGIDFFSSYICEDHLIGDLIWRSKLPGYGNHGLVFGETAIQPMSNVTVSAYVARRVRWLRVRKWTVLAATMVEPAVEAFVHCLLLSWALTTLPWFHERLGVPQTRTAMAVIWLLGVTVWMFNDWRVRLKLYSLQNLDVDQDTPSFARGTERTGGIRRRAFLEWFTAWLLREAMALPIWTWAVLLGTTVTWRGRTFRVRMDMSVVEIGGDKSTSAQQQHQPSTVVPLEGVISRSRSKDRLD